MEIIFRTSNVNNDHLLLSMFITNEKKNSVIRMNHILNSLTDGHHHGCIDDRTRKNDICNLINALPTTLSPSSAFG
ncbi:hypothetical protein DERP_006306 [Dermatophagoides pteronyssinus]|uniref:Uncharacterized protein n=1 Tax=Dermatophagoides pteronyssinus TaxID=6956 RepID=A0ABQ8IY34_DERPT|nr:hypothetical protein DERP_006306 [Dermatophagoides pteronyssinus]